MMVGFLTMLLGALAVAAKPNFLILFVDDLGMNQIQVPASQRTYSYTGSNGTISTPHISRLASEGMVFQNWYSAAHLCSPSRAAMMTGRLPIRSGCIPGVFTAAAVGGLPKNETTMAAALSQVGYKSLAIGKWHLGQREEYLPTSHGFDEYFGIPYSQDMGLSYWFMCIGPATATGEPPKCDPPPHDPFQPTPIPLLSDTTVVDQPAGLYTLNARYAQKASAFMESAAKQKQPFLLYLAFNHVHAPNSCGAGFCGRSSRGPIGDAVEEMDWAVGQVMDTVRSPSNGISKDTLVFFTSDNGAPMRPDGNLPLRGYKTSIWEGGFREPGIVWWPGRVDAGSASNALVATYDIFTTAVNLAGAAGVLPAELVLDGVNLAPLFSARHSRGDEVVGHDCIMFYHAPHTAQDAANLTSLAAIRCGDHKVYWFIDETSSTPLPDGVTLGVRTLDDPVIFDLSTDWSEARPLVVNSSEWSAAKQRAEAARLSHLKTLSPVLNMMDLGSDHKYAICGAPNSPAKYPHLPNCTVTPSHWSPPICLVGGTIDQCIGQTLCQPGCKFVNCSDQSLDVAEQQALVMDVARQ